ncbi:MAG: DUF4249 domain-containing protein [Bacteroidetes bacterium]|nr:DUF4249 domain-containing protein [Bacteroidota bacterium]
MKIKKILFIFSAIACLWSCEKVEDIVDFPRHKSRLVVNGFFHADSRWEFDVSKSLSVIDNAPLAKINNASIQIFENDILIETLTFLFKDGTHDGFYYSDNKPVFGKNYSIVVSADGFETVSAADKLPTPVPIVSTDLKIIDSSFFMSNDSNIYGYINSAVSIKFNDPAGEENFYQLEVLYHYKIYNSDSSSYQPRFISFHLKSDDLSIEEGLGGNIIFSDLIFDGQTYEISAEFTHTHYNAPPEFTYYIYLKSLSKSCFLYKKTYGLYLNRMNNPFAEPVQVYNNIENGFGIFAGYVADVDTIK